MLVVPTLVLPRDNELEILGRTVERTLGRSVESIDVLGRGTSSLVIRANGGADIDRFSFVRFRPPEQGKPSHGV